MARLLIPLLCALTLNACSSNIEEAKKTLEDSLVIKTDIEFADLKAYEGDVVCGLFSAYVSYHEARKEDAPFIVIDGKLDKSPSEQELAIYCTANSASALLEETGIGPFNKESQQLLQIIRDFNALSNALERYNEDTFEFPSEKQGLKALITKPEGKRIRGKYNDAGYMEQLPSDPWGRPYRYFHTQWRGVKGKFEITTQGQSNEQGGTGLEADVSSKYLNYLNHVAKVLDVQ